MTDRLGDLTRVRPLQPNPLLRATSPATVGLVEKAVHKPT